MRARDLRIAWRSALLASESLSWNARLAGCVLVEYLNERSGSCHPSYPTIARAMGVRAWRVARDGTRELEAEGLLSVAARVGVAAEYTLLLPLHGAQELHDATTAWDAGVERVAPTRTPARTPAWDADEQETRNKKPDGEREANGAAPGAHGAPPADLCTLLGTVGYHVRDIGREKLLLLWERDRAAVRQAAHTAKEKGSPSGWFHAWLTGHELPAPKAPRRPPCEYCEIGGGWHASDCPARTEQEHAPGEAPAPLAESMHRLADPFADSFGGCDREEEHDHPHH